MKKLITFGDSWVWGVGAGYNINQTRNEYFKDAWNQTVANTYSFRAILSKKYNLENINFSHGVHQTRDNLDLPVKLSYVIIGKKLG